MPASDQKRSLPVGSVAQDGRADERSLRWKQPQMTQPAMRRCEMDTAQQGPSRRVRPTEESYMTVGITELPPEGMQLAEWPWPVTPTAHQDTEV